MKFKWFIIPSILLFIVVILSFWGCAKPMGKVLGAGFTYQNAETKLEDAQMAAIEGKTEEAKKLTDQALELFLQITNEEKPGSKYAQKAQYQIAEIYKGRGEWDNAIQHYQTIIDAEASGYLSGKARSGIANIRKNRQIIADNTKIYQNVPPEQKKDPKSAGYAKAAKALYAIGEAYENLGSYREAIKNYSELVDNFSEYTQAPQAQFKIGNIYFYKLYDYSNEGGWGAFLKVTKKFPDSFEASQAATVLKKADQTLKAISQEQAYVLKYRREKGVQYKKTGRYVDQSQIYSVFGEQVAQAYINIARGWEIGMRNYPYAIKAYKELVEELPMEKFVAADALFQIGRLYQENGDYEKAIIAYDNLFKKAPESQRRDEAVYQRAVSYEAIREFTEAYEGYKAYMSLGKNKPFYRQAEQKVRQMEYDQDGDGYPFYKEQEAGTSDEDPNDYPGARKTALR